MEQQERKSIVKMIHQFSSKHNLKNVFLDFVTLSALAINLPLNYTQKHADLFEETMKKYSAEEQLMFADMFESFVDELEESNYTDILGTIYEGEFALGNKNTGQFFTPDSVSSIMNKLVIDPVQIKKTLEEKNFHTIADSSCGSGRMFYPVLRDLEKANINYQQENIFFYGKDIDIMSVYMTYLQLSLWGAKAKVVHGNALTASEWDVLYTPACYLDFKKIHEVEQNKKFESYKKLFDTLFNNQDESENEGEKNSDYEM